MKVGRQQLVDDSPLECYLHFNPFIRIAGIFILDAVGGDFVHYRLLLRLHDDLARYQHGGSLLQLHDHHVDGAVEETLEKALFS